MNDEFKKIFNEFLIEYTDKINKYYTKLNNKKKKLIISTLIVTIILVIIFLVGTWKLDVALFSDTAFQIIGTILITIILICSIVINLKREQYTMNENIILDIIKYISKDENSFYYPNKRITTKNIEEMELFNLKNLKYNGKNVIGANYKNNIMNFADMEIYYYKDKITEEIHYDSEGRKYTRVVKDKIKKVLFSGCYISATLNKKVAEHIYLIPNNIGDLVINGKLNNYITYSGNEIELENLEFSEKYKVYSDDEIQARYILSLKLMEQINNIDSLFDGKKYIVFKEGRRFVICIQDFKIEELRKTTLPLNRNSSKVQENLEYIFRKIYNLFDIYNILDLGNDLYVDNYVDKK